MHFLDKTKRNHGLEHAAISLLMPSMTSNKLIAGYSVPQGFLILGQVETESVQDAVEEALVRVKSGEASLTISEYCGTNILVSALLTTLAIMTTLRKKKNRSSIFKAISFSSIALVLSVPIGKIVQKKYTTSADFDLLKVCKISKFSFLGFTLHWIETVYDIS